MKNTSRVILFLALAVLIGYSVYAASTITASVHVAVEHSQTLAGALGTPKDLGNISFQQAFTNGTSSASAQINTLYYAQRTLTTAQTEALDLYGTLTNTLGETVNFRRVKAFYVKNTSTTQTITIGTDTAAVWGPWISPATATVNIPPSGGCLFMAPVAGWAVTDSSADILQVTNSSGATAAYDIWIIGTNAI